MTSPKLSARTALSRRIMARLSHTSVGAAAEAPLPVPGPFCLATAAAFPVPFPFAPAKAGPRAMFAAHLLRTCYAPAPQSDRVCVCEYV